MPFTRFVQLRRERSLTTILISHDLSVVYGHADKVFCLSRSHTYFGSPVDVLTPEHLRDVYGTEVRFHDHSDAGR